MALVFFIWGAFLGQSSRRMSSYDIMVKFRWGTSISFKFPLFIFELVETETHIESENRTLFWGPEGIDIGDYNSKKNNRQPQHFSWELNDMISISSFFLSSISFFLESGVSTHPFTSMRPLGATHASYLSLQCLSGLISAFLVQISRRIRLNQPWSGEFVLSNASIKC